MDDFTDNAYRKLLLSSGWLMLVGGCLIALLAR